MLDYIRQQPFGESNRVVLTCNRQNSVAMKLYRDIGFAPTGSADEDEDELVLFLG